MNLEDIMRRFVVRREGDPPPRPIEPYQVGHSPVVLNGMVELLRHLAEMEKHIQTLEKRVADLEHGK